MDMTSLHIVCLALAQIAPQGNYGSDNSPAFGPAPVVDRQPFNPSDGGSPAATQQIPRGSVPSIPPQPGAYDPAASDPSFRAGLPSAGSSLQFEQPGAAAAVQFNQPGAAPPSQFNSQGVPPAGQFPPSGTTGSVAAGGQSSQAAAFEATDPRELAASLLASAVSIEDLAGQGSPLSLTDALGRVGPSSARRALVAAYWKASGAVADAWFAGEEVRFLSQLQPHFVFEQTLVDAELSSAEARQAQAALALLQAQEGLADLVRANSDTLPLPADPPFIGEYQTRFGSVFSERDTGVQLRRIDRALPHQLRLIERRAAAVAANGKALDEVAAGFAQEQIPLSVVLEANRRVRHERQEFMLAVLAYNRQIAEYAFGTVGTALPAEMFASTLIRTESTARPSMFRDSNVLPAAARAATLPPRLDEGFRVQR